jgi:RHS repeat-associated protein
LSTLRRRSGGRAKRAILVSPWQKWFKDRNSVGFTGHVMDPGAKLVYMQQRYYDPAIGRFLSPDPVQTDLKTGGSFNRYAYAAANPYRYIDPDGRAIETPWDVANVALDVASLSGNVATGNWGAAALDFVSLAYDGTATVIPGLPAGGGVSLKVGRALSKAYSQIEAVGGGVRQLSKLTHAVGNLVRAGSDVSVQTHKGARHALDLSATMDMGTARRALESAGFKVSSERDGTVVLVHAASGIRASMYSERSSDGAAGISFQYNKKTLAKVSLKLPTGSPNE